MFHIKLNRNENRRSPVFCWDLGRRVYTAPLGYPPNNLSLQRHLPHDGELVGWLGPAPISALSEPRKTGANFIPSTAQQHC